MELSFVDTYYTNCSMRQQQLGMFLEIKVIKINFRFWKSEIIFVRK